MTEQHDIFCTPEGVTLRSCIDGNWTFHDSLTGRVFSIKETPNDPIMTAQRWFDAKLHGVRAGAIKELQDRDRTLSALEAAGVDNWEGYCLAFEDDEEDED